ncbi:MAG: hypothetical protein ACYSU3_24515 [Planctomycetota bacterium]|jgi:hypothetical protein
MKIPKSFELFGQTINVVFKNDLTFEDDAIGATRFRRNEIWLQTKESGRPEVQVEQTFLHELVHWILHELNYDKLRDDEQFVDNVASLLHQAFTTAKYK